MNGYNLTEGGVISLLCVLVGLGTVVVLLLDAWLQLRAIARTAKEIERMLRKRSLLPAEPEE